MSSAWPYTFPSISIAALIYRSAEFATWCYEGVKAATPEIAAGEALFYFVANDADDALLDFLCMRKIPFVTHDNEHRPDNELFRRGYAKPEYISRVYRGWNRAIQEAPTPWVVLLNSDHIPAPGWLGPLKAAAGHHDGPARIACAQQIERWHPLHGRFIGSVIGDYGAHPSTFQRARFLTHAAELRADPYRAGKTAPGGAYMPCMFRKQDALDAGLYPEGNLAGSTFDEVKEYGDQAFFRKLKEKGIEHVTALDSIVYHAQEGEMRG